MLRRGSFRYTIQAHCELADAVALLSHFDRQAALHPLIVRVRELPAPPGVLRAYRINDRLAVGPLRFRTSYRADVLRATEDEVVSVARQWPSTRLENNARLRREPDGLVRVDVEITLSAPAPLFPYAFRQARTAHLALATRLRETLDSPPAG
ncbi:SRPBCC family protein [Micromonospora sp. NPDC049559]|uniref:SRPBCC family protein n=1 Tax=Micromonospora sp. NPDC049559 TaxID=3155923 RepID=UPI003427E42C